jgi:hypothetical protein
MPPIYTAIARHRTPVRLPTHFLHRGIRTPSPYIPTERAILSRQNIPYTSPMVRSWPVPVIPLSGQAITASIPPVTPFHGQARSRYRLRRRFHIYVSDGYTSPATRVRAVRRVSAQTCRSQQTCQSFFPVCITYDGRMT